MTQKIYPIDKFFCHHQKLFLLKNIYKTALLNLVNFFILYNIVFNLTLNFKLKINLKMCTFKNLEEIGKSGENFEKMSGNPDKSFQSKIEVKIFKILNN